MTQILTILDQLAANPSKTFKEQLIGEYANNEVLKRVFYLAYQPTLNFYTRKLPQFRSNDNPSMTLEAALTCAEIALAQRTYTGKAAADYLQNLLESVSREDAEVLSRVVMRDLRIGCAGNTANKVWKDLILDVPYMRCCLPKDAKLKDWPWADGIYSQLKSDGSFARLDHYEGGGCGIGTRNGTVYPDEEFGEIYELVRAFVPQGMQLHGELLIVDQYGDIMERAEGNGILTKIAKGGTLDPGLSIKFTIWDIIPISEAKPKNKYKVAYKERLSQLEAMRFNGLRGAVEVVETKVVHNIREAYEHYQEQLALGLEGTILKHPDAIWEDTTSKYQVKFKIDCDVELEVVGFNPGKGKNKDTFGSIQCKTSDGLLTTNVSGMKDDVRKAIWEDRESWPGKIITVRSNAMTKVRKDGTRSLFLPRMIEERTDKSDADDLARVEAQFEAVIRNLEQLVEA